MKKLTIITVSLNSEDTIADTVKSVRDQTFSNYEHIVFDGGSTDKTLAILEDLKHPKLQIINGRDRGIYDAMNQAWQFASGDIVQFLNSDDILNDNNVLAVVSKAFEKEHVQILCTNIAYFRGALSNQIYRFWSVPKFDSEKVRRGWHPPHPGFFCTRHVFEALGGFDLRYKIVADFDFMVRACLHYKNNVCVANFTSVRMRAGGVSDASVLKTIQNNIDVCRSLKRNDVRVFAPVYIARRLLQKIWQKI